MHPLQCSRSCPLLMISLLIKSLAGGSFPFVSYLVFWVLLGMEQIMSWLFLCVAYLNIFAQFLGCMTYSMHWVNMVIFPPVFNAY
jgi:hypothetical protein